MARECGSCSECCYAFGVHELGKPTFAPCEHIRAGEHGSCGVYETRPPSCRDFSCLWLQGQLEEEHRPDKVGIVFATADLEEDLTVLLAYVNKPGADKSGSGAELLMSLASQVPVGIYRHDGSQSLAVAESERHLIPRVQQGLKAQAVVGEDGKRYRLPVVE